jgi:ubiquitin-activating enzyme E1
VESLADLSATPTSMDVNDDIHLDFMTASSNLFARCFRIKEASTFQTKRIAAGIAPSTAAAATIAAGLMSLELYKCLQSKSINAFRAAVVNLAVPSLSLTEPAPPATTVHRDWKWTLWDCLEIDGRGMTLQQLLDYFENTYGLAIEMLSFEAVIIYSTFGKQIASRLPMLLPDICASMSNTTLPTPTDFESRNFKLVLDVFAVDDDGNEVDVPQLHVKFD